MALVINTNVSSLTAQRALAESSEELKTAMERLSTGSKINSAADDAAGLAMTQRMTAQVRGLAMAVKNANDGQALTQSIEGALGEVSDMLQRMRELALQAANGTNSSADRTFLQSEVNLLIQEISRVAASTRYNGELILDGTFLNKALQVGIEEGENIIFSVESVAAENVGAHTLIGNGVGARAASAVPLANPTTESDDLEIFGFLGTKSTAASTGDSAKQTAVKVNNLTGETGVKAYAKTYASLESTSSDLKTYSVKINGYTTGNFVVSSGDVESAVDAINQISGSTGVTASSNANKVVLFDSDGDDITIENLQSLNGFTDLRVSKLGEDGLITNVIGSVVDLGLAGAKDSTRVTGTLKLVSPNPFSLDQKVATAATGILVNDASTANGDTVLTLDPGHGLAIGGSFTMAGETGTPVHYVTGVSTNDITFVPPLALVTGAGGILVNDASTSAGDLTITLDAGHGLANGHTFTIASETGSPRHMVTNVSGNNITFVPALAAGVANDAAITIGVIDNAAITIGDRAAGILVNDASPSAGDLTITLDAGHGLANGHAFTIAGETGSPRHIVTNVSGNNITFVQALAAGVANDAAITIEVETPGYYVDGSSTATLKNLTQIRINTAVLAGDSISIIDAALDKVAQMRSDLGAIENRLAYTVSNLMNIAEKTADARSRLDDADFALESARLAKSQVIQQAGTNMLAQANQMTQLVLDLLR